MPVKSVFVVRPVSVTNAKSARVCFLSRLTRAVRLWSQELQEATNICIMHLQVEKQREEARQSQTRKAGQIPQ
jgi:hypothetical protein